MKIAHLMMAATAAVLPITGLSAQMPTPAPATFVMKAGAGDQYEIQSSKIVLQTTKNTKLRQFATMMLRDHTKSTADVKAAAAHGGVRVSAPTTDAKGKSDLAALRKASGVTRDELYVTQQKAAHEKALMLHQDYAANGTSTPLKAAAAKIAPVVQTHVTELQSM